MTDLFLSHGNVLIAQLIGVTLIVIAITVTNTALHIWRTQERWQRNWRECLIMHRNNLSEVLIVAPLVVIFVNAAGLAVHVIWRMI